MTELGWGVKGKFLAAWCAGELFPHQTAEDDVSFAWCAVVILSAYSEAHLQSPNQRKAATISQGNGDRRPGRPCLSLQCSSYSWAVAPMTETNLTLMGLGTSKIGMTRAPAADFPPVVGLPNRRAAEVKGCPLPVAGRILAGWGQVAVPREDSRGQEVRPLAAPAGKPLAAAGLAARNANIRATSPIVSTTQARGQVRSWS